MTELVQDTLFGPDTDETFDIDYSDLLPAANKIMDAAATYMTKCGKKLDSDDMFGPRGDVVADTVTLARQVIRLGATINWTLRNPMAHLRGKAEAQRAQMTEGTVE